MNTTAEKLNAAIEQGMRNDLRFRRMVDACTAAIRDFLGPVDPSRVDQQASEYAEYAAATMLAYVYTEDGELATLKAERDRYKKLALSNSALRFPPQIVVENRND